MHIFNKFSFILLTFVLGTVHFCHKNCRVVLYLVLCFFLVQVFYWLHLRSPLLFVFDLFFLFLLIFVASQSENLYFLCQLLRCLASVPNIRYAQKYEQGIDISIISQTINHLRRVDFTTYRCSIFLKFITNYVEINRFKMSNNFIQLKIYKCYCRLFLRYLHFNRL